MTYSPEECQYWEFKVPSDTLKEIQAMSIIESLAQMLDEGEITRVLHWATDRYKVEPL